MTAKYRIPITAVTVFGASSVIAVAVGIVLYLGLSQAAESTRQLWGDQSETLIDAMEYSLDARLKPVRDQARWVAKDIRDVSDLTSFDRYMYGTLAATPQVAGVAIITPTGTSRRWHREELITIEEDWSTKPWFEEYMTMVNNTDGPTWRNPIFSDTVNTTTLLHDIPLRNAHGEFIGVFAQIVKVQELAAFLSRNYSDTGTTPFVLYNRNFVLFHPHTSQFSESQVLPHMDDFGDLVLARIWSPDEEALFISEAMTNTQASGIFWGDDYYLFLYREINHYGPAAWVIGAYLNTTLLSDGNVQRISKALWTGLTVLVIAVLVSIFFGRKVSTPIKNIVSAANTVNTGKLDAVDTVKGSHIRELDDASNAFNNMVSGLRERELIRDTLGRFVPEKIASTLLAGGGELQVQETEATILFCDIEAFTRLTEMLGPVKIVDVLNAYFSAMVDILEQHGGVVTQFQGDAILATFNVPIADHNHVRNAILAAQDMLACVDENEFCGEQLSIRIGINAGSVVAGAIGARGRLNYTVHGDAVNLAARLESMNKEYGTRVLLSDRSVTQAQGFEFIKIGETTARGQSQTVKLYTLASLLKAN